MCLWLNKLSGLLCSRFSFRHKRIWKSYQIELPRVGALKDLIWLARHCFLAGDFGSHLGKLIFPLFLGSLTLVPFIKGNLPGLFPLLPLLFLLFLRLAVFDPLLANQAQLVSLARLLLLPQGVDHFLLFDLLHPVLLLLHQHFLFRLDHLGLLKVPKPVLHPLFSDPPPFLHGLLVLLLLLHLLELFGPFLFDDLLLLSFSIQAEPFQAALQGIVDSLSDGRVLQQTEAAEPLVVSVIVLEVVVDVRLLQPVYELFLEYRQELRGRRLGTIGDVVDMYEEYKNANINRLLTVLCFLKRFTWDVILGGIE